MNNSQNTKQNFTQKTVAIIGAGAGGLMAADFLAEYNVNVEVYEQMPSAGRKILWAGKTGLNITHSEPITEFVRRYTPKDWLTPFLYKYSNQWLIRWFDKLGIQTYVGSSGRVFPVEMKASKFLRAWLLRLLKHNVNFFYRHSCIEIDKNTLRFLIKQNNQESIFMNKKFDAIILACGGVSYPQLGSNGIWQHWFDKKQISPLYASNVGITKTWSDYMKIYFGKPLKRVDFWLKTEGKNAKKKHGDIIISHYGMESGLIYYYNQKMRTQFNKNHKITIYLDLLPNKHINEIKKILCHQTKQSFNTKLCKTGLDDVKIAVLRECTSKNDWQDGDKMAKFIKELPIDFDGFRPIAEAISTGGGVKKDSLTHNLQLVSNPSIFCAGEMLDFDAPTGGYLLTACFATGRIAAEGVVKYLQLTKSA